MRRPSSKPSPDAHGFRPGDGFDVLINGRKRHLSITGITLSPEYVYAIGPGDMVPDQKRFGVIHMNRAVLEGAYDMKGAFNNVSLTLARNADRNEVMARLDTILKPHGGTGAYDRTDHMSDAFLDSELTQLRAMAQVIPPIFLLIAAFLVNMILSRLIALEREQIGLLKAVGYSNAAIAWHYAKLTLLISLVGVAIGAIAGTWLGQGMASLYGEFYSFPFLVFSQKAGSLRDLHAGHLRLGAGGRRPCDCGRGSPAAGGGHAPARADRLSQSLRRIIRRLPPAILATDHHGAQTSGALADAHRPDDTRDSAAGGAADYLAVRVRFRGPHDRHRLVQG